MSTAVEQQVNLYQPIFRAERRLFSAATIALALSAIVAALGLLWGFGYYKLARLDRELAVLQRQEAARVALVEQTTAELRPKASLAELEASNRQLALDLEVRRQALALLRQNAPSASTGFAEQLTAIARRQIEGVWLTRIVLLTGEGRLALVGAASRPPAIPAYVEALAEEPALAGAHFDDFTVERVAATRHDGKAGPEQVTFRLASAAFDPFFEKERP